MQDKEVYVICNGEHSADVVATALNELLENNKRLKEENDYWKSACAKFKEEKDYWKSACAKSDNENVILKKELLDVVEQGYELSNSYNEYLEERKKDMLKHYSDKRRVQKRIWYK